MLSSNLLTIIYFVFALYKYKEFVFLFLDFTNVDIYWY